MTHLAFPLREPTATWVPPRAAGDVGIALDEKWQSIHDHFWTPASRQSRDIRARFDGLTHQWRAGTRFTSSLTEMIVHPAYLQIIGMGEAVVPLLLREVERRTGQWGPALSAITGAQPVLPNIRGHARHTSEAWVKWGRDRGYRW